MSSVLTSSDTNVPARSQSRQRMPGWMHEPLLHFVALGVLLFAVDRVMFTAADDPRVIAVDASVDREAIDVFKAARARAPNEEELYALRRVWLDNEVLYREGLLMELDKGDKSIRERVIFKALSVIDAGTKLPAYDDEMLRKWFEANHVKYDEPVRFDFQEAVLSGNTSEATSRSFAAALNTGDPGEAQAGLRVFNGRPHANIVENYGEPFARELESSSPGEWRALESKSGWRVIRLEAVTEARPASFDNLRGVVLQDWTDATMSEQRSAAVRALAKKYTIKTQGASE